MADSNQTVAIFNASDDTVEMLKVLLSNRGYRVVSGHADEVKSGELDFIAYLKTHQPSAIIWDISPPYDRNWNFVQLIRELRPLDRCAFVLTTTHKQHLDALAKQDTGALEVIGKPYDLEAIVNAVVEGLKGRNKADVRPFAQS
jgi:response regulator RpfG family c-di-GMP phosphodiesterase